MTLVGEQKVSRSIPVDVASNCNQRKEKEARIYTRKRWYPIKWRNKSLAVSIEVVSNCLSHFRFGIFISLFLRERNLPLRAWIRDKLVGWEEGLGWDWDLPFSFWDYLSLAFEWAPSSTPPPPPIHPLAPVKSPWCLHGMPSGHLRGRDGGRDGGNRWRWSLIILALNLSIGHCRAARKNGIYQAQRPSGVSVRNAVHKLFYRLIKCTTENI